MKKYIILSVCIIVIIRVCNYPIFTNFMDEIFSNNGFYSYSNGDATYTSFCKERKGNKSYPPFKTLSLVRIDSFFNYPPGITPVPIGAELRQLYPNADTVVYRLFIKNPFIFWRWREYIFGDPKYEFPYKSWKEIEKQRPKDFKRNNQWQKF